MDPTALVIWETAGLANRLHSLINALYIQETTGRVVYSCWPLNDQLTVPVSKLFEHPLPLLSEELVRTLPQAPLNDIPNLLTYLQNTPGNVSLHYPLVLPQVPSAFIRKTLKAIKWHPSILELAEEERVKYNITSEMSGIHARGTDVMGLTELRVRVKEAVSHLLLTTTERIFICSDELELLEKPLNERVVMIPRLNRYVTKGMIQAVVDLLLLSSTNIRYYSPMSTYSWVAIALSEREVELIPRGQRDGALREL